MKQFVHQPGDRLGPRAYLILTEGWAIRIRKLLASRKRRWKALANSGLMGDAEALADTIETLSRRGRNAPAANAIEISECIELLVRLLVIEIDTILTL